MIKIKIKDIYYGDLKRDTHRLFKRLMYKVASFTLKNNGKIELKNLLTKLGIKTEINEEGKFTVITNKTPNIFEKNLLKIFCYETCSSCGKFIYAPRRSLHDIHYSYPSYGESFPYLHKPICEKCAPPILEQWKEQVKGLRDRWVKRECPDWIKTETCYIDKDGETYPL